MLMKHPHRLAAQDASTTVTAKYHAVSQAYCFGSHAYVEHGNDIRARGCIVLTIDFGSKSSVSQSLEKPHP